MRQPSVRNNQKQKLKRRSEFLNSYKGRALRRPFFTLYLIENDQGIGRFGVTVPKATGNAVIRNRYKRWVREIFRNLKLDIKMDVHLFVGSKRKTKEDFKNLDSKEFKWAVERVLDEACRK